MTDDAFAGAAAGGAAWDFPFAHCDANSRQGGRVVDIALEKHVRHS